MSKLARAVSGAAATGEKMALAQMQENLMAKRDARLAELDLARQQGDQAFRTSEREAGQDFASGEKAKDRAASIEEARLRGSRGGAVQGDIQLMDRLIQGGVAKDDTDAFRLIKGMRTDPNKTIMDLAKMMQKVDEGNFEQKPIEDYLKQAKTVAQSYFGNEQKPEQKPTGLINGAMNMGDFAGNVLYNQSAMGPLKSAATQPAASSSSSAGSSAGGPVQIQSDEEYSKLNSGDLFVGPDGKTRRKP